MASNLKQVRGDVVEERLRGLKSGLTEKLTGKSTLKVAGTALTKAQLLEEVQKWLAPYDAANAARVDYASKVATRDAAEPDAAEFVKDLVTAVEAEFGRSANVLMEFGIAPPKARRELTVEEKTEAVAKRLATRKLRNTMGSRQKESIKAPGPVTVTVTHPSSTSTSQPSTDATAAQPNTPTAASPTNTVVPSTSNAFELAPATATPSSTAAGH